MVTDMDGLRTWLMWLVRAAGKPESLLFKNQREAAEFVRKVYNKNPEPNTELRSVYTEYQRIKRNGVDLSRPSTKSN
jgi:hypothetical protein